jgi:hypothetical protein
MVNASWMVAGEMVWIDQAGGGTGQPGIMQVASVAGNNATLMNATGGGAVPSTVVPTGVQVSPAGKPGPNTVSTDAGNIATLGSDSKIFVPNQTPTITSVRLRSYNALAHSNCNFEVDQRLCGTAATFPANADTFIPIDRWSLESKNASTGAYTMQQISANVAVPGTSYLITRKIMRLTLTAAQATLGSTDFVEFGGGIEGPFLRELVNDVHSISILCRSSVANLKFGSALSAIPASGNRYVLSKLCTLGAANTWTLITLPNLPVFPTGFGLDPGFPASTGYWLVIQLAEGASRMNSANDVWVSQPANVWGAIGMSNFSASPVNSTFDLAFIQHEPGLQSTTLMDLDFQTNLIRCQRYWQSSYDYGTKPGTVTSSNGSINLITATTWTGIAVPVRFPVTMAQVPTMTFYSPITGASGNIRNNSTSADMAVSGPIAAGTSGYGGVNTTANAADAQTLIWHHVADTGW